VPSALPAFWSQTAVSQSAAIAAGTPPPITQPKKRPLDIAVMPGSAPRASSAIT
jgi:hypothetical protein